MSTVTRWRASLGEYGEEQAISAERARDIVRKHTGWVCATMLLGGGHDPVDVRVVKGDLIDQLDAREAWDSIAIRIGSERVLTIDADYS